MFWDDIKLVTEKVPSYGLRLPLADLGGGAVPLHGGSPLPRAKNERGNQIIGR